MAKPPPGQSSRFVVNPMLEQQLMRSSMLLDDLVNVAEDVKDGAYANAPEDEGYFKEGMRVEAGVDSDGVVTARFIADDWKSVIIEYGTSTYPFSSPIRRAIESLGLKLVKG
jgi:hypothetical protein